MRSPRSSGARKRAFCSSDANALSRLTPTDWISTPRARSGQERTSSSNKRPYVEKWRPAPPSLSGTRPLISPNASSRWKRLRTTSGGSTGPSA